MSPVRLWLGSAALAAIAGAAVIGSPAHDVNVQKLHPRQASAPLIKAQDGPITLTSTGAEPGIVVLDYGVETEGIPSFEVVSASGDTSALDITYSETKDALSLYMVRHVPPAHRTETMTG